MKITIVYESMFGNTYEVARAISDDAAHPGPPSYCTPAIGPLPLAHHQVLA